MEWSDLSSQNVSIASGSVVIVFGALGSSSQSVLRILNVSAEYYGILRFLYTIILKLYIFKSRSHALCTSVCRFI